MSSFSDRLKYIGKEITAFFTSPIVLKNLGLFLATIISLLFVSSMLMKSCTRHGEALQVEDYSGMRLTDAIKKARNSNFRIAISDSLDRGNNPPNMVLSQDPAAFSKVKKNRTIYLTITKSQRDQVMLPNIIGADEFEQYAKKLARLDIKSEIKDRVLNDRYAANTILKIYNGEKEINLEDIKKGVKIDKGSTLYFDVTELSNSYTSIPEIRCEPFDRADFLIRSYQLVVGTVHLDPTVVNRSTAFVYKQVPEFSSTEKIRIGQQIDVYLTQNRPDDCPYEDNLTEPNE
jgi:hypothetical protein